MVVGGIVRANNGEIFNCYNNGEIYSEGNSTTIAAGGIAGMGGINVESCYNSGIVEGFNNKESSYTRVGGIIGDMSGNIQNCYNVGDIQGAGNATQLGGIAGFMNGEYVKVENCYNVGIITDQTDYKNNSLIGGIIGCNYKGSVNSSYFLKNNSILGVGKTINGISNAYEINTKDNMPIVLSIVGNQFKEDINNINKGYSVLSWQ